MKAEVRDIPEELAPLLDRVFKYEVGEHVVLSRDVEAIKASTLAISRAGRALGEGKRLYRAGETPVGLAHLVVVERWVQQCHGGIQISYTLQGHNNNKTGERVPIRCFEYELRSVEESIDACAEAMEAQA